MQLNLLVSCDVCEHSRCGREVPLQFQLRNCLNMQIKTALSTRGGIQATSLICTPVGATHRKNNINTRKKNNKTKTTKQEQQLVIRVFREGNDRGTA